MASRELSALAVEAPSPRSLSIQPKLVEGLSSQSCTSGTKPRIGQGQAAKGVDAKSSRSCRIEVASRGGPHGPRGKMCESKWHRPQSKVPLGRPAMPELEVPSPQAWFTRCKSWIGLGKLPGEIATHVNHEADPGDRRASRHGRGNIKGHQVATLCQTPGWLRKNPRGPAPLLRGPCGGLKERVVQVGGNGDALCAGETLQIDRRSL